MRFLSLLFTVLIFSTAVNAKNEFDKINKKFSNEPSVEAVQKAAIKYAEIHPEEFASWLSQSRWSNTLPEFEFKYRRNIETDKSLDFGGTTGQRAGVDTDEDDRYEMRAKWKLSKLVYSGEEPKISREVARKIKDRENIVSQVTRLYFQRRKLQIRSLTEELETESEKIKLNMQIAEYTALLDGLTNDIFKKSKGK